MSYPDPPGGPTSRGGWPHETEPEGRDAPPWARHNGAAPDPYAGNGHHPESWANGQLPQTEAQGEVPDVPDAGADAYSRGNGTGDEPEVVADPDRPRGPGRRRADRSGRPVERRTGRAGRNLRAAIAVGASLVAIVVASLVTWQPAFLGVVVIAASVGIWEMVRAVRQGGMHPPLVPLLAGGVLMIGLAWFAGPDALALGLFVTLLAVVVWRLGDGPANFQRDVAASALIAIYVPFLLGFGILLVQSEHGSWRVLSALIAVVLSDTGGYAFGVFLGRHPMAPSVSPKKSWEGFGGSVFSAAVGGALLLSLLLDATWWQGAIFGAVIAVVAVVGDLGESMIKRDLKIKDMSQLLPGHGGLMDRLDSILFAVPAAYLLLSLMVPAS